MTVYLLQYNNYYNRLVKYEETLNDYQQYIINTLQATNFKPNDYVNAEQIITLTGELKTNWENGDYVLVVEGTDTIVSRWFVTESVRLSNAQHRLSLRRDVIADYFNIIKESPIFVEKAILDSGNPLIFNNENMSYNQIKVGQEDLFDDSNTAWIAMYVGLDCLKNTQGAYEDKTFQFTTTNVESALSKSELIAAIGGVSGNIYNNDAELKIVEKTNPYTTNKYQTKYWVSGQYSTSKYNATGTGVYVISESDRPTIASVVRQYDFSNYVSNQVINATDYNGVIVRDGNSYYKAKVTQIPKTVVTNFSWSSDLGVAIKNATHKIPPSQYEMGNEVSVAILEQTIEFQEVIAYTNTLNFTLKTTTVYCNEAPYYLLYLPYNAGNLNIAIGIAKSLGSFCYDIQIVPYCPEERNRHLYHDEDDNNITIPIKNVNTTVGYIYSAASNSFSFDLDYNGYGRKAATWNSVELKVQNETQFVRLNSPNGQGSFEMSVAKNYGLEVIHVECTYKPINPYINICPQFKGLYGSDFQDYRGLICQGDFSIPLISDAWVQYEQQNKNYQNIFDREIENMDFNNKYARYQERIQAGVGVLQGASTGAAGGAMVGGPWGAVAGAAVGAASSLAGGVGDLYINEKLRSEARDLKYDMFGYQLGNIKARPNTLAKTGSMTIDNHYVPYIEIYECTETEKEALRNKIKYNGMTVGVIGKMEDYIHEGAEDYEYFKGQLIRIDLNDDFHLINTIANELNQGVYIK